MPTSSLLFLLLLAAVHPGVLHGERGGAGRALCQRNSGCLLGPCLTALHCCACCAASLMAARLRAAQALALALALAAPLARIGARASLVLSSSRSTA